LEDHAIHWDQQQPMERVVFGKQDSRGQQQTLP
jgi:hypothetical protein